MATSFPTSKDILHNPHSLDSVQEVSHSEQHSNANDAIEALETKVGVNNSTDVNSLDYKVKQLELNFQDPGEIKDLAASIITGGTHTGITVSYNDTTNLLNLTATYDDAEVVTAVATALTAGNGITKTYVTTPSNYRGEYNNGEYYAINDTVIIPVGSPYGIVGSYFIRSGNPGNPGYPPEPGGATNGCPRPFRYIKRNCSSNWR